MSIQFNNLQLLDQVQNALVSNGHSATVGHRQISDKSLLLRIRFNEQETFGGEQFQRQLYLYNVNNGKTALRMYVGLFRLVCTNGLVVPATEDSAHGLRIIHRDCKPTHEKLRALPDLINRGLDSIENTVGWMMDDAREVEIRTDDQAIQVIGNLNIADNTKRHAIYQWTSRERPEDTPNNAWSLYNVVNESIRLNHGEMTRVGINANRDLYTDVMALATDVTRKVA